MDGILHLLKIAIKATKTNHVYKMNSMPVDTDKVNSMFIDTGDGNIEGILEVDMTDPFEVDVDGTPYPYRGYYRPRDRHGNAVDIRKVVPSTGGNCTDCKLCAEICPMGSIDHDDVSVLNGICIKCCACVKRCPVQAKYFDDPNFVYHKKELEDMYSNQHKKNKIFLDSIDTD